MIIIMIMIIIIIIIIIIYFAQIVSIHRRHYSDTVCDQDLRGSYEHNGSLIVTPDTQR